MRKKNKGPSLVDMAVAARHEGKTYGELQAEETMRKIREQDEQRRKEREAKDEQQ